MEYKARIGSPVQLVDGVGSGWAWAIVIGCQFGGVRTRFICPIPVLAQQIQFQWCLDSIYLAPGNLT